MLAIRLGDMKAEKNRIEIQTLSVFVVLSILTLLFVFGLRMVLFAPSTDSLLNKTSAVRPGLMNRTPSQVCVKKDQDSLSTLTEASRRTTASKESGSIRYPFDPKHLLPCK